VVRIRNYILLIVLLLAFVPFSVHGIDANAVLWLDFNDTYADRWGVSPLDIGGSAVYTTSYPTFNKTGDGAPKSANMETNWRIYESSTATMTANDPFSVCSWIYPLTDQVATKTLFAYSDSTLEGNVVDSGSPSANTNKINGVSAGGGTVYTATAYNTTEWTHMCFVFDGSYFQVFLNGVGDGTHAWSTETATTTGWVIGGGWLRETDMYYFDGYMDEVKIYSDSLTDLQVRNLYNCNNETICVEPPVTSFVIYANDFDNSSLTNFSALVNGTELYSTTDGTIITDFNQSQALTMPIEVRSTQNGGYFNTTYSHVISSDLTATLTQTEILLNAFEFLTDTQLYGFFLNETFHTLTTPLYWKAGTYNIIFNNESYFNKTQEFIIPALFNGTLNITGVYDTIINVSAVNGYSGQSIYNFTGWAYNIDQAYNTSFSAVGNYTEIPAISGNDYQLFVNHTDYAISSSDNFKNVTVSGRVYNASFSLYSKNSIRINIYDEQTTNLITGTNISIVLTGNASEDTYYTTTGHYILENLTDGLYTLKFAGGNYTTKTYSVTVADQSTQNLNAYMSSNYATVIFTVSNSLTGGTIEGATFTASKQINSTWTVVESKFTDVTGRVQVSYLPNVKYKYSITLTGYVSKIFYLDPVIFSTYSILMTPIASTDMDADYEQVNIVYYPYYFFNNAQNNLTFLFASPNGVLESYGFNASFPGGSVQMNGSNSIGEDFNIDLNITGALLLDTVNITYWYDSTIGDYKEFSATYGIIGGTNVLNNTISYIRAGEIANLGAFEKALIGIFFIMILVGLAFMLGGLQVSSVVLMLGFGLFAWLGFFPLWGVLPALLVAFILIVWGGNT